MVYFSLKWQKLSILGFELRSGLDKTLSISNLQSTTIGVRNLARCRSVLEIRFLGNNMGAIKDNSFLTAFYLTLIRLGFLRVVFLGGGLI